MKKEIPLVMEAQDFIKQFHGISGELLKDRKKNFHFLLKNNRELEGKEEVLKEIIDQLHPQTYLEETYRQEFLIYFKRVWELFELLKSGDSILTSRIIKQSWFLSTIMKDLSPKDFVKNIFPQFPRIVKLKILKQILKQRKDEEFINSLFDELDLTYGYKFAMVVLSGCSVEKIKEFLNDRGPKMSLPQLKLLHDKDRSLISFYYEEFHKRGGDVGSLYSISRYLSRKDPELFMELMHKYKFRIHFCIGRRKTKEFVENNKNEILNDPIKYVDMDVLNRKALMRQLGKDSSIFLKPCFPESWKDLYDACDVFEFLRECPRKKRYDLFSSLFKEVYNKDLYEAKDIVNEDLLEVIPCHETREKWVEIFNNEIKFIQYKRSSIAVPELKEKLLRADDITFRKVLLEYIVNSCKISEDYTALLEILNLVCKRFLNADEGALYTFLDKIQQKIKLKELNEEHWKCIHKIISMQDVRNISMNANLIFEYCKFQYKSGRSFEKMIPLLLKCDVYLNQLTFKDKDFRDEEFRKKFILLVLKYYVNLEEKYRSPSTAAGIVLAIRNWNKKHPKETILASQVKDITEGVKEEIKSSWVYCHGIEMCAFKYLFCFENDMNNFESIYFENINTLANYSITRYFLKYKPEVFRKYIDKISPCFTAKGRYLTRVLKKFEYTGLIEDIQNHYTKKLTESENDERDTAAQLLASIMPNSNFLNLLEKYVPKMDKLEISEASQEEKTLLQIEMALAKSVRFSISHEKALPIIFEYCKGMCLPPALFSLYSCFNRVKEDSLELYLQLLMDKPVSLRKHAIFLAALAFPITRIIQIGDKLTKEEKDISVKKHLFTSTYKYFLKNPIEKFWDLLNVHMASLTIHDKESLNLITKIQDIPKNFKGKFAETVWKTLERLEDTEKSGISKYYNDFFDSIKDFDVRLLSSSFCIEVIKKKFFEEDGKRNEICSKFAIQFMMYSNNIRKAVKGVMEILSDYKNSYWDAEKSPSAKSVVYYFCQEIFNKAMSIDCLSINIPSEFGCILKEEWQKVFKKEETFEEYLMLEFIIMKHEKHENLQIYSKKIADLFENDRKKFGDQVLILVLDFLENSLSKLLGDKKYHTKLMGFLRYFIENGPVCQSKYLLVIHLLPVRFDNEEFKINFNFVVKKIRELPDPIVALSLNKRFKIF